MKSNHEKVIEVCEYILKKHYGDTVTIEELNEIIQENLKDEIGKRKFKKLMSKAKNKLISCGYVIRSIYNVGYYILKPNQISSYTYRNYIIKPLKQFDKANIILKNTDKKRLNTEEIKKHRITMELNRSIIYATNTLINDEDFKMLKEQK